MITLITDSPMPNDFDGNRTTYPFASLEVGKGFLAGNVEADKKLKGRIYRAIHSRKSKSSDEVWKLKTLDNGDLQVWRTA